MRISFLSGKRFTSSDKLFFTTVAVANFAKLVLLVELQAVRYYCISSSNKERLMVVGI